MTLIFEGLTVVGFGSGVACDLPTMVLADNGARVLKIEPLTGDPLRRTMASAFLVWNRGKESVALDLSDDRDRTRAAELIAMADVVVEAFAPGVMDRLGLGATTMLERNPALVYASIKAFGSSGPYAHLKGYEGIVAAKAGGFAPAAFREGPAFFGMPRASVAAGHLALQGITAALVARETTGRGQYVETDLMSGLNVFDYFGMAVHQLASRLGAPPKQPGAGSVIGGYLCSADGRWVLPTNRLRKELEALVRAVDLDAVWDVPEYRLVSGQGESPRTSSPDYDAALWETIRQEFRSRPLSAWLERMNVEDDLAAEWMRSCEEGLDHPQVLHNGHVVAIDDPTVGPMRQVGPIASFSATPSRIATPAPAFDDHGPLERSSSTSLPEPTDAAWPTHPLSGITIVELGHHFAMPYAITLAAALGARVIKVEPPHGDHMRDLVPYPEAGGHKVMDGKESIIADVTTEEGRGIVYDLVRRADVFALGLRQPAADRMLMNASVIRDINPDIVYFSATGYGDNGPFVGKAMHAGTASVSVGAAYHQSSAWLDPTLATDVDDAQLDNITSHFGAGAHNGDAAAAASAASALLLAIFAKQRFDIGQYAKTTMLVGNAYSYSDDFNAYEGKPSARLADPEQYGLSPVYRLYRAASGWVFLAVPTQREWREFCAVAAPALADARSLDDDDALAAELSELFASRSADEWEALLVPHGIGCVAVYEGSASQFTCTDGALRETEHVVEVDHPIFGRFLRAGLPQRFSHTPGYLGTGCWAGEHTNSVLNELGYSAERIAALEREGVTVVLRSYQQEANRAGA